MYRSTEALQSSLPASPNGDRRRSVRHKLHTPVFASFNGPQTGTTVDLSELVDLNEGGFCVQTGVQSAAIWSLPITNVGFGSTDLRNGDGLEVNHPVTICLDLPETKSYVHGSGLVVWRDDAGRAGIRFSFLSDRAMATLKEWLFVNLLVGTTNHTARAEQREHYRQEEAAATDESCATAITAVLLASASRDPQPDHDPTFSISDCSSTQLRPTEGAAVDGTQIEAREANVSEVRDHARENAKLVASHGNRAESAEENGDQIFLQSIADQALTLTGASGSALALLKGQRMVCYARAGHPSPPLGSEVNVEYGLSGECLRTGQPAVCEDAATDPRVDNELCRAIGIGSFAATPVLSDFHAVGLLEVFSPQPGKFSKTEADILERLAELVFEVDPARMAIDDFATPHADYSEAIEAEKWDPPIADFDEFPPTTQSTVTAVPDFTASKEEALRATPFEIEIPIAAPAAPEPVPPVAVSPVDEPLAAKDGAPDEAAAVDTLRDALRERVPELEREAEAAKLQEQLQNLQRGSPPSARSYVVHLGLILSSLAAVCLALGYLLAPVIERHLYSRAPGQSLTAVSSGSVRSETGKLQPEDLRRMAEQGNPEAQFLLGTLYRGGDGVLQNDKDAVDWFQRAADQGYVRALSALGSSYWSGRGVPQDYAKAYFWYQLALAEGDQNSKSLLEGLSTQLTGEQVASVRQQAEAWLHAHHSQLAPYNSK